MKLTRRRIRKRTSRVKRRKVGRKTKNRRKSFRKKRTKGRRRRRSGGAGKRVINLNPVNSGAGKEEENEWVKNLLQKRDEAENKRFVVEQVNKLLDKEEQRKRDEAERKSRAQEALNPLIQYRGQAEMEGRDGG